MKLIDSSVYILSGFPIPALSYSSRLPAGTSYNEPNHNNGNHTLPRVSGACMPASFRFIIAHRPQEAHSTNPAPCFPRGAESLGPGQLSGISIQAF